MKNSKALSGFVAIGALEGVYTANNANLRCSAIKLIDEGICLFSPVAGLDEAALSSLAKLGPVTHLLAPNHYHNRGLTEYANAFPAAKICAPAAAVPRLEKQTGLSFEELEGLEKILPDKISILEPIGLKTGEIWLRISCQKTTAWLVVDAICGSKMGKKPEICSVPDTLKTFPSFGVADKEEYRHWFDQQLRLDAPEMVVPCHGNIISAGDLPDKLSRLQDDRFG